MAPAISMVMTSVITSDSDDVTEEDCDSGEEESINSWMISDQTRDNSASSVEESDQ